MITLEAGRSAEDRLGAEVLTALHMQRRRQLAEHVAAGPRWQDRDFVFTTPTGGPLDHANVLHAFQAAVSRAGLPHQRFHDLRHACATLLLEQGEELGGSRRSWATRTSRPPPMSTPTSHPP